MQLLPRKACERPDRLLRQLTPHAAEKWQQRALIFRLERLAAEQRETVDIVGGEQADELVLRFARERLAVAEVPRLRLKAVFAVVRAAGDKQRHTHAKTVGDVAVFDLAIVHGK